jgi:hypothetical protein
MASLPDYVVGLQAVSRIPSGCLLELAERAIAGCLNNREQLADLPAVPGVAAGEVKCAILGISAVLLEAARADSLPDDLQTELQGRGIPQEHVSTIATAYSKCKEGLRVVLSRTQFSLPQLVGVTWRLDCVAKSKHLDSINRHLYILRFLTIQRDGSEEAIECTCAEEELTVIYHTLRQATHQVGLTMNDL